MSFALDLSVLVEKAKGETETVIKRVMLETFQRVILKSPVDTGRFRANWQTGFGSYSQTVTDGTDASGTGTIRATVASVSEMKIDGTTIYLTNSLPYAVRLEYGYSQQAPVGMVRTTLAEITSQYGS